MSANPLQERGLDGASGTPDPPGVEISFVIPVFNGARTIGPVVERILAGYGERAIEIVLVNDGSSDDTEGTCNRLAAEHGARVCVLHLARNFGEHSAVLAGLNQARGEYVAVLDDDGQNPPEEVARLHETIVAGGHDVVYGRYRVKRHGVWRNLGSRFNDRVANFMLRKPRGLYLSSFKIMNRFLVDEITRYKGAFPYIDGLILRATARVAQIEVEHRPRAAASSGYTLRKLIRLWMNMFLNFSIMPLRVSALLGLVTSGISLLLLVAVVVDKLYINPGVTVGLPTLLVVVIFFAGVQLLILGTIGEYLGRLFLDSSAQPQFVVRYVRRGDADGA